MKRNNLLYVQVVKELEMEILSGRISLGQKLPPLRQLAAYFHVNPNTVQRAVAELERSGFVQIKQRVGIYVTSDFTQIARLRKNLTDDCVQELFTQLKALDFSIAEIYTLISNIEKRN